MYFLTVLEARSQNRCQQSHTHPNGSQGESVLALPAPGGSSVPWLVAASLQSLLVSSRSTLLFSLWCLCWVFLRVGPATCAIGFSKQNELYALMPLAGRSLLHPLPALGALSRLIFLPRLGQQTQSQGPMLRDALQLPLVLPSC